jgi:hypothetical protein
MVKHIGVLQVIPRGVSGLLRRYYKLPEATRQLVSWRHVRVVVHWAVLMLD